MKRGIELGVATKQRRNFNSLALELFEFQFKRNDAYRNFCLKRDATPESVREWEDIPAVPTAAFKTEAFCAFPANDAVRIFETSGTTRGQTGRHFFRTLEMYDASALPNFERHVLPDGAKLPARMLLPPPDEAPHSSLVYMCDRVARAFCPDDRWFVRNGKLDVAAALRDFKKAETRGESRLILGTSFAFVHLIDAMAERDVRIRLPAGSRIMETGGYKGRAQEIPRDELVRAIGERLGVPPDHVINEYGMTELSSQFYDDTLRSGRAVKVPPPGARVKIIDPSTMREARPGSPGLIRIWDLANVGSCVAVQTEDLGVRVAGGFQVLGRASGADLRGCSLAQI